MLAASAVLRLYASLHPEVDHRWHTNWAAGRNAPDVDVNPVLWQAYIECNGPCILDGYPRTRHQLADFIARGGHLDTAVLLDVPDSLAVKSITHRASQPHRIDDASNIASYRIKRERQNLYDLLRHTAVQKCLLVLAAEKSVEDHVMQVQLHLKKKNTPGC